MSKTYSTEQLTRQDAVRRAQDPADRDGKRDPKSKRRARQLRAAARLERKKAA